MAQGILAVGVGKIRTSGLFLIKVRCHVDSMWAREVLWNRREGSTPREAELLTSAPLPNNPLVCGGTGAGKTTLVSCLRAQAQAARSFSISRL